MPRFIVCFAYLCIQKEKYMAQNLIRKYVWLVETIYKAKKITFNELNKEWLVDQDLSEGIELSLRTFHKWRDACEEIFGINIECERKGGYHYSIENAEEIKRGGLKSWLLNTISVSNLLMENQSLKDKILLENIPSSKEYLSSILDAMKRKRLIHINYYNYWRDDERQHYVMPLCVKLFRQRWYMVGKSWSKGMISVFCLDRIQDFRLSSHTFEYPEDFNPETYFEECFGVITGVDIHVEHVVLKVSASQANYLRDLPMHKTQHERERHDEYSIFELDIRPTYDFQQEILWNGEKVEVLKPAWLRKEIADKITLMWNKYNTKETKI